MSQYVRVIADQDQEGEIVEIPTDQSLNALSLDTVRAQFPSCVGIKYRNEDTKVFRALQVQDGYVYPPEDGWGDRLYIAVLQQEPSGPQRESRLHTWAQPVAAEDDEDDRGRSRSPVSREGRTCYKCGGVGHIAAMCPSLDGARNDPNERECHLCHGKGHIKARCPNSIPRGVCYRCGMYGHNGRDCMGRGGPVAPVAPGVMPPADPRMFGGFRAEYPPRPDPYASPYGAPPPVSFTPLPRPPRRCYRCGNPGHVAAECPRLASGESASSCYRCGLEGHLAKNCPHPQPRHHEHGHHYHHHPHH